MTEAEETGSVPPARSWSAGALWPTGQIALGVGAVWVGVLTGDPLAVILTVALAAFLIPLGVLNLVRRPRIEVVDESLALRRLRRVEFVPRSAVTEVRALDFPRWGTRHHQMRLEYVDAHDREQLEIFTRMDLGADPRDVVEALHRYGFRGPATDADLPGY